MKTDAIQPVLEKVLNGRYHIIQVLSVETFGQTYIADDSWVIGNPQCLVKHLKPNSKHRKQWQICKRLFQSEAEILKKLGKHDQIPQLIDCFKDNQGFYLVQELVAGQPLSAELASNDDSNKRWSEVQCVELLQDVLGILEFTHRQGIIHGDLKPNNLIRRSSDGKLVLIDFGVARQIDLTPVKQQVSPISSSKAPLGYIPPEQFRGQPYPNSDLYALGMIAIQALTGLNPAQLQTDPDTGEVNWQQEVSVSEPMACVLNQMVLYNFKERYQSATDVRNVLKTLLIRMEEQGVRKEKLTDRLTGESLSGLQRSVTPTDTKPLAGRLYTRESRLALPKVAPLLTGMGAGMATSNALVISFGLYYLLHPTPSNPGLDVLLKAAKEYQAGNLDEAISLAQSVPLDSSAYQESLIALQEWRQEWNLAADQFKAVEQAFNEGRWRDVLKEARKTPNIAVWQQKIEPFVEQAKPELELEAQQLLQQAYQRAALKDFTGALALLKEIPPETPTGIQIQPKLSEYSRKQQIKADSLLQQAYSRASERDFIGALEYLSQIPEETPAYETAQIKMAEYSQKQDFKEEVERQVQLSTNFPKEEFKLTKLPQRSNSAKLSRNLNPGSHLKEVTPKPVAASPAKR